MAAKLRSFNSRELSFLAQQPSENFSKEGILMIKEKQEGIFRKGEVYMERLFRLKGNMLFYFKTRYAVSEVVGVIILERYVVELDAEEDMDFSFVIVFGSDEKTIKLAAKSEAERDSWIEHLHIASYECLKLQLQSLRERIACRTGKDPIDNPEPTPLPSATNNVDSDDAEPFIEMGISCENLPLEINGRHPDTFATVHYLSPPNAHWVTYSRTEIIEKCTCPRYLTTISFRDPDAIMLNTRIKLSVYFVKEKMTHTMAQIGQVQFTVGDLLGASGGHLQLRLNSHDLKDVGNVTILAWQNESQFPIEAWNGGATDGNDQSSSRSVARQGVGKTLRRLEMLKLFYSSIVSKTFRFPTNSGGNLSVHEYMGESKLTYALPKQLLKLWVDEEKLRIEELQNLGELTDNWDGARKELMDFSMSTVTTYMQNARYLSGYQGAPFKPSAKKGHKEVEFAPTNLHVHRAWVQNDTKDICACYDITTVGAFTAYAQKYKHGGLRSLLRQFKGQLINESDGKSRMDKIGEIANSITALHKTIIEEFCEGVCRGAIAGDSGDLSNSMDALTDKTRQLVQVCEHPLLAAAVSTYSQARMLGAANAPQRPQSDASNLSTGSPSRPRRNRDHSPDKSWKWSGTDFVKSPTEEPWELTRANVEASLLLVLSKVEEIQQNKTDVCKWLEEISPLIIKLKRCVEVLSSRAKSSLTFLTIQECGTNIPLMHTVKYRRDVCFSQALTAATAAFITKLRTCVTNDTFLRQCFHIGVLMEFESLLSCHGSEMGMIEDMTVAVNDLAHVSFKVEEASTPNDIHPIIRGNRLLKDGHYPDLLRCGYEVSIPVPSSIFSLLPKEIQRGHVIKIVPVLFTIGINEQATLAERIGDTSLQHSVNAEFYHRLHGYYEKYVEIFGELECQGKNSLPGEQLMRHLHINVMSKKNKNVEVLHLAAEVCRKLNGVRYTSCKSAKDRTSVGVTLEITQLLQREHDLASHIFMHALDCMRSEGVRRENTVKNTGSRKYAFNVIQLMSFPKLYKPPSGTYGNNQS